jgi:O-antigen/teichoic acid export membrane protein
MATIETPKVMPLRERFRWVSDATWVQIKEYAPTFLTEFAVIGSQIVVYKLAAHFLGKEGFSEYAVARRAISTIYPVALLGFGVGLPRYIAISTKADVAGRRDRFFGATLWCVGVAATILITLINLMPSSFAYIVYGNASYKALAFPVSLIIGGLIFHAVVYSYFRGHMLMARANVLQFVNLAVVPLLGFYAVSHDVGAVLRRIGLLSIFVSFLGFLLTPWQKMTANSLAEAKMLLRYGVPRVAGDFALVALLGFPTFMVAHKFGVQGAGYVAFGVSLLGMIAAVFAPIGLVLLPKASGLIARGASEELRSHLSIVFQLSLVVSAFLTILVEMSAGPLVRVYLGRDFSEISTMLRIIMLGAVPYAVYTALRSAIDARHFKAINTKNCVIALVIFASCSALLSAVHHSTPATLILPLPLSLLVLGTLTWSEAKRLTSSLDAGIVC